VLGTKRWTAPATSGKSTIGDDDTAVTAIGTSRAAFEAFYLAHFDAVLGFVTRRVRDAHTAADLTAEMFVVALGFGGGVPGRRAGGGPADGNRAPSRGRRVPAPDRRPGGAAARRIDKHRPACPSVRSPATTNLPAERQFLGNRSFETHAGCGEVVRASEASGTRRKSVGSRYEAQCVNAVVAALIGDRQPWAGTPVAYAEPDPA